MDDRIESREELPCWRGRPVLTEEERKVNIRLWVAALRSGEYPQDVGALRTAKGFCCLGVACEVARTTDRSLPVLMQPVMVGRPDSGFYYMWLGSDDGTSMLHFQQNGSSLVPPVQWWLGGVTHDPDLRIPPRIWDKHQDMLKVKLCEAGRVKQAARASMLNDSIRMDFADIADCIEFTFLREDWDAREAQS